MLFSFPSFFNYNCILIGDIYDRENVDCLFDEVSHATKTISTNASVLSNSTPFSSLQPAILTPSTALTSNIAISNAPYFGKGVHFVGADGGFEASGDNLDHEWVHTPLLLCQIIGMLGTLRTGGNFVVKVFYFSTLYSEEIFVFLSLIFDEISVTKPVTSRPISAEKFIVGLGLKLLSSEQRQDLIDWLWMKVNLLRKQLANSSVHGSSVLYSTDVRKDEEVSSLPLPLSLHKQHQYEEVSCATLNDSPSKSEYLDEAMFFKISGNLNSCSSKNNINTNSRKRKSCIDSDVGKVIREATVSSVGELDANATIDPNVPDVTDVKTGMFPGFQRLSSLSDAFHIIPVSFLTCPKQSSTCSAARKYLLCVNNSILITQLEACFRVLLVAKSMGYDLDGGIIQEVRETLVKKASPGDQGLEIMEKNLPYLWKVKADRYFRDWDLYSLHVLEVSYPVDGAVI